jgi:hypothetical protein
MVSQMDKSVFYIVVGISFSPKFHPNYPVSFYPSPPYITPKIFYHDVNVPDPYAFQPLREENVFVENYCSFFPHQSLPKGTIFIGF